jgi:hypothetical protein
MYKNSKRFKGEITPNNISISTLEIVVDYASKQE